MRTGEDHVGTAALGRPRSEAPQIVCGLCQAHSEESWRAALAGQPRAAVPTYFSSAGMAYVHHIAILNYVLLAFQTKRPLGPCIGLRSGLQ